MKKIILLVSAIICLFSFINLKEEEVIIPDEAIRLRVIANSNTAEDQNIKKQVRDNVQKEIIRLTNKKDIEKTRENIKENIASIEEIVNNTLKDLGVEDKYDINYGYNYFPDKKYKGVTYKEGYYESLVITLGEGSGENFWCVLFPPLCLLDAEESDTDEVEYKFFIQELFEKYF